MKTKQGKIIKACKVLNKFNGRTDIPMKLGFELYQIRSKLSTYWDFQVQKEQEIFQKYKYSVDQNGSVKFDDKEEEKKFTEEYRKVCDELADQDVVIPEFAKQVVHLRDDVHMSPDEIADLYDFVAFVE